MDEERYNNRQIERMFDEQSIDLKQYFDSKIEPLVRQVTITNGTVKWQTKMLYMALGALPILTFISAYMFYQVTQLQSYKDGLDARVQAVVSQSVQDALSNYEINP